MAETRNQAVMRCGCEHPLSVAWQKTHFMDGDCCHPVPRTDQTAQGEAGGVWECVTCGETPIYHGEGVAYHKSLGHRVEVKS